MAQSFGFEELVFARAQMQGDGGSPRLTGRFADGELAGAVRRPVPSLWLAGLARNHLDALRNHEGRIEADAELADQRHVLAGIAGQRSEERRVGKEYVST